MGVEFVQGRPGKAMDRYLNEKAAEPVRKDPTAPVYVVAPRQYTYGTEAQIQEVLGAPGMIGLQVTSMDRLSRDILENVYGGAVEMVDMAGKSMLIRGILDERRDELTAFRAIASASDLPASIAEQLAQVKQMEITPDELAGYAHAHPESLRIRDLAVIYAALEEKMTGRLDSEGALSLAMAHMEEAWFLKEARIIVRGFSEWSTQQIRFVQRLMDTAAEVYIELPQVADGEPDQALYSSSATAALRLSAGRLEDIHIHTLPPEDEPGSIVKTACELFSWGRRVPQTGTAMEIASYADAEEEVRGIAAEIVRLHLEEKVPFEEMAIVWGETSVYEPLIRRIFSQANIPYFTGDKKNLAHSNLAEYVLTACELADGQLKKEVLLAHAATGFTDLAADELGTLENYADTMISWGREFREPFGRDPKRSRRFKDDLPTAEAARRKLMEPVEAYLRTDGRRTAKKAASVLAALELYTSRTLTDRKMEQKSQGLEKDYEQASFMEQSVRAIERIVGQAHDLLGTGTFSGAELRRILRAGFAAVELSLVPAALKEVQAGPVGAMYVPAVSHLFVVGVNDEVLPRFGDVSGDLLTTQEWDALVMELRSFAPMTRAEQQKYQIVRTMMQVRDKIHWSYQLGGEMRESVLIGYLKDLYKTQGADPRTGEVPKKTLEKRMLRLKQNAYDRVVSRIRAAADGGMPDGLLPAPDTQLAAAVLFDPAFADRTAQLKDSLENHNEAVPVPPKHPKRTFSATRVQEYGRCPYSHFLNYQLGVWVPDDPIVDYRGTGTFMHRVMEKAAGMTALSQEEFDLRIREAAGTARSELAGPDPHPRSRAFLEAAQTRILQGAQILHRQQQEGLLTPLAAELGFRLQMDGGANEITGIIDRLDTAVIDGRRYLSLTDYKSSAHDLSLPELFLGTDVQLVLYLLALEQMMREGRSIGDTVLTPQDCIAGGGFLNLLPAMDDRIRRQADIPAAYRLRGLLCVEPDRAKDLYGFTERVSKAGKPMRELARFRQEITKNDAYSNVTGWRIFPTQPDGTAGKDFEALLGVGRARLLQAVGGSSAGVNTISPAESTGLACAHCNFRSICRFESGDPRMQIRRSRGGNTELRKLLCDPEGDKQDTQPDG